jgi:hypothetical protein
MALVGRLRIALFTAGTLVAVTGHIGGLLVWGADFLHPSGRYVCHGQKMRKNSIDGTF